MGTLPYRGPRHFPRMRAEAFNALPSYIGPSHTCDRTRCLVFSPSPHPPVVCWSSIQFPNNYHNIYARFQAILLRNVPSISFRRTFPAVRPSCSSCSVRTASPPTRGILYSSLCSIVSPRPRIRMYSPSASRLGVSRAAIFPLWVLHEIPRIPQIQIRDSYTPTGLLPTNKTSVSNSVSSLSNHMNVHICPSRHQVTTAFSPGQTLSLSFFVTPTVRDFLEVGMTTAPPGSPAGHETWFVHLHRPSPPPRSPVRDGELRSRWRKNPVKCLHCRCRLSPLGAHLLTKFGNSVFPETKMPALENLLPLRGRWSRCCADGTKLFTELSTQRRREAMAANVFSADRSEDTEAILMGLLVSSSHDPEPRLLPGAIQRVSGRRGYSATELPLPEVQGAQVIQQHPANSTRPRRLGYSQGAACRADSLASGSSGCEPHQPPGISRTRSRWTSKPVKDGSHVVAFDFFCRATVGTRPLCDGPSPLLHFNGVLTPASRLCCPVLSVAGPSIYPPLLPRFIPSR